MEDFIAAILMSEAFPNRILGELMRMAWILFLIFGIEVFMTWCMDLVEFISRRCIDLVGFINKKLGQS